MGRTKGRRDLTSEEESLVIGFLLARLSASGELLHGSFAKAAQHFGCHRHNVRKIWAREQLMGAKPTRGGSARKYDADELKKALESVPVWERQNVRAAAAAIDLPPSTLQDYISGDGPFRRATVHVKPTLTDEHKIERLRFVLTFVERPIGMLYAPRAYICVLTTRAGRRTRYFQDMFDMVHIDEKWFYIHNVSSTFILTEDEELPTSRARTSDSLPWSCSSPWWRDHGTNTKNSEGSTAKSGFFRS
jgi:hypothetical protein